MTDAPIPDDPEQPDAEQGVIAAPVELFLSCPKGVESLLLGEVRALGAATSRETVGGVLATGTLDLAYRACLWSRLASRVLMPLTRFDTSGGADALYGGAHGYDWPQLFDARNSFAIEVAGHSRTLTHSHYAALKVKDAVADRFRAAVNKRPDVDLADPDLRIHLHLSDRLSTLSLDLSGEALHRRGYRNASVEAPLKENLAAALLLRAGWPAIAAAGGSLFDPFCGSGTLPIEAGWMAGDIAPGLMRERWGFAAWNEHEPRRWRLIREEALARRQAGLGKVPPLFGRDRDPQAVRAARANGARAGLTGKVDFADGDATRAERPADAATHGLVIANPPYGERLADEAELVKLHSLLGARVQQQFPGWRFGLFTGRPDLGHRLGLRATRMYSLFNGAIPCKLLVIDVPVERTQDIAAGEATAATAEASGRDWRAAREASRARALDDGVGVEAEPAAYADEGSGDDAHPPSAESPDDPPPASPWKQLPKPSAPMAPTPRAGSDDFANRLRKNLRHLSRWAERSDVSCYRLYDADLPEYAVAIDLYRIDGAQHAVVQEYAPPKTVDTASAERRLRIALLGISEVLQLPAEHLHYKLRRAQKPGAQYRKQGEQERFHIVEEHGAKLWVNFDDYLDTGLFLDHRPIRRRLRAESAGKRVLNLFCYTGAATVQAALGGATGTVSIDLSNTYLDWLAQNLELNGLDAGEVDGRGPLPARRPTHSLLRADVTEWLQRMAADDTPPSFDVVFCDPPTFSNSKKMETTWDVQRDHVALLLDTAKLLAADGALYFSCNRQRFKLDVGGLQAAGLAVQDITARTLDEDFKRPPPPHRAWLLQKT